MIDRRDEKIPLDRKYSISEFATQFDISPRTIRYYEEKGLLSPERSSSNHRFYTKRDRAILKLILRGKNLGSHLLRSKRWWTYTMMTIRRKTDS
jgi:Predicted transcriptional regulators